MVDKYKKPFLIVFSSNLLTKAIGFLKEILLGWTFGATKVLDNFLFITSIPNLINATWNRAIETVLLPSYMDNINKYGEDRANKFLAQFIQILTILSIGIWILLFTVIDYGLRVLYGGLYEIEILWSARIVCIAIIVETIILTLKVKNFSQKRYFWPTILPIFQSSALVLGLLVFRNKLNLKFLSIIYVIGTSIQIFLIIKWGWFWSNIKTIKLSVLGSFGQLIKNGMFLAIAAGISTLNIFVDKAFALRISEGSITIIHYGAFFLTIYQFLFVQSISTIFYPQFQEYVNINNINDLESDSKKIVKVIFIVFAVISIIIINNGYYLLKIVLGHGKMKSDTIKLIYQCLLAYGLTFLGIGLNAVLIRVLHVFKKFKFIFYVSIINFTANLVFNYLFTILFGIWGIPLSTSVSFIIIISFYFIYIKKNIGILLINFRDNWYLRYGGAVSILIFLEILLLLSTKRSVFFENPILNIFVFILDIGVLFLIFYIFKIISFKSKRVIIH